VKNSRGVSVQEISDGYDSCGSNSDSDEKDSTFGMSYEQRKGIFGGYSMFFFGFWNRISGFRFKFVMGWIRLFLGQNVQSEIYVLKLDSDLKSQDFVLLCITIQLYFPAKHKYNMYIMIFVV